MKATSLWHESAVNSDFRTESLAKKEGTLLVRSLFSLVSIGTETLVATGGVPEELYDPMAVPHQQGDLGLPAKYGYSLVGEVVAGPGQWKGRCVHLMHPHQDYCVADPEECTPLPAAIPPRRGTLIGNAETALTAVWDSKLSAGDRVLVVGFGLIGALTAKLARRFPAAEVWVAEVDAYRRSLAEKWGFALWNESSAPFEFDISFNSSRSASGLQRAIDAVGMEGRIVELSWYGARPVKIRLGGAFHHLRKRIISSQVSTIPAGRQQRWGYRRRKEAVLRILDDPNWDSLLDTCVDFSEAPRIFQQLREGKFEGLSCTFRY